VPMEPLPQTIEALRELARQGEVSLGIELYAMARRVRGVVPELVGLSLGVIEDGVTLTLVASTEQLAALDAVQYLDGGPCVAAVDRAEPLNVNVGDLLDEDRWGLYARASAAIGVASSLSLPIMDGDRVVGGVNLYASTEDAFTGLHEEVAQAVGSDPALAVANADLSFSTAKLAIEAPNRIREGGDINNALGIIAESQGVNISTARERLRNAAARAGITEAQAARAIKRTSVPRQGGGADRNAP
jgi:GAF domain-containing protein